MVGTLELTDVDGLRVFAVVAHQRPMRQIAIKRGKGLVPIDVVLGQYARQHGFTDTAFLTADKMNTSHLSPS